MNALRRIVVPPAVAVVALTGTALQSAPATASDDFAQHVVTCVTDMGFTGDHNPGMHRGASGWDPDHQC